MGVHTTILLVMRMRLNLIFCVCNRQWLVRKQCLISLRYCCYHDRQVTFAQSARTPLMDPHKSTNPSGGMRFVQFRCNEHVSIGVKDGQNIVDLNAFSPELPRDLCKALTLNREQLLLDSKRVIDSGGYRLSGDKVELLSPITSPDKVLCVGNNYHDHCAEQGIPVPTEPILFSKFSSTLTATEEDIPCPSVTKQLDWEVELAIIIAKKCKNIQEDEAMKHVFGYSIANDLSARDLQFTGNGGQWILGKSLDKFCPFGPEIVTKEALIDPHNLKIKTTVNGIVKQDSNTNQMVFKTASIVSFASKFFTLLPGDVILTGTPPGVGKFRKPEEYLQVGDTVSVSIEELGTVTNKIV